MRTWTIVAGCALLAMAGCRTAPELERERVPGPAATTPAENDGARERNAELARRARMAKRADLVWLGDSITEGWELYPHVHDREFAKYAPLNLGVSGDRTEHVLWRLERGDYDGLAPRTIVVMIGTNNTGHRMDPPADIAAGIRAILRQLKARFPKARVALLAIFPCGENEDSAARRNNEAVNALLPAIAKEEGAEWLNLNRAFVDARGTLSRDLMPDLLHPNQRGYEVWANAIREPIARWMR